MTKYFTKKKVNTILLGDMNIYLHSESNESKQYLNAVTIRFRTGNKINKDNATRIGTNIISLIDDVFIIKNLI